MHATDMKLLGDLNLPWCMGGRTTLWCIEYAAQHVQGGACMVRAWRMGSVLQQQETSLSSVFLLVATEVAASLLHQLDATERRLNGPSGHEI